ncbi:protein S100-A6-like [Centropristis striata]|uniref:protein S100-A6-like n=1 Tax=Centropristis striata TaxID=184440 RepID=UPI0027DEB7F2|nr:protein S100-A6-like [Centropristis striata]
MAGTPRLLIAMVATKEVFDEYAKKDGDARSLSKAEVSELLHKEMGFPKDSAEAAQFFEKLDEDKNGVVSYQEYIALAGALLFMMNL